MTGGVKETIDEAQDRLHRAGWSVGMAALATAAGGPEWVVSGNTGEDLIRAEGATQGEAWRGAPDQARAVGMPRWGDG
jgi:hypothetical protein